MNVERLNERDLGPFVRAVERRMRDDGVVPEYFAPVCINTLVRTWELFVQNGIGAVYGLNMCDVGPSGFLMGLLAPDPMSGWMQGLEYLWVVHPAARRSGAALELLRRFEADVKASGGQFITVGAMSNFPAMRRMYRRLGYVPHSEIFRKGL